MFDFLRRLFKPVVFEISIKDDKAELTSGKATRAFVKECAEICQLENLHNIRISGVKSDYGIRLEFSANIPESCRQKLRNIWEIYK